MTLTPIFLSILLAVIIAVASNIWLFHWTRTSRLADETVSKQCQDLYQRVIALPSDVTWYSDPSKLRSLPFPSLHQAAQIDRFRFNEQGYFTYVGREKFPEIVDAIRKCIDLRHNLKFNLYATMGHGKSHILAALACYFTCLDRPVVYIPDSAALVSDFVTCVKLAFMSACAHPSRRHYWPAILNIRSVEDAISFSQCTSEDFLFIVDQLDALDVSKSGTESDKRRAAASALAELMTSMIGRVVVESVSANSRSYETLKNSRQGAKMFLFGGMSETEMASWWELWDAEKQLPAFKEADDRSQIEYMTGRVPLLLSPLFAFRGQNFEDIAESYWKHDIVRRPQEDMQRFAETYRTQYPLHYDDFIQTMGSFLAGEIQIATLEAKIDRRYLYRDENRHGQIVCGIAREALAGVIRQASPRLPLGQAWSAAIYQYRDNPSVLGFLVEQQCIAIIASLGLRITDELEIPLTSITPFLRNIVELEETGFYVPTKPNCMAIDCVYAVVDETKRTAHIIPVQIAIAKKHSDSETKFFQNWKQWTQGLATRGYQIEATFVRVVEDSKSIQCVEAVQRTLRSGLQGGIPAYNSYRIPLSEVNAPLAERLKAARRTIV